MPSQSESDRQQCYNAAVAAGIPKARLDQFIAENGWEDICRANTALAPNPGPGGTITALFNVPGLTATQNTIYDPARLVQAPGSNANPLSTVSANSVSTGPAIAAPAPVSPAATIPAAPASSVNADGTAMTLGGLYSSITAAPGGVTSPAVVTTGAAPATAAGFFSGDNKMLLLVAAAVVVYLLLNRG